MYNIPASKWRPLVKEDERSIVTAAGSTAQIRVQYKMWWQEQSREDALSARRTRALFLYMSFARSADDALNRRDYLPSTTACGCQEGNDTAAIETHMS